jgi:hypothetical protein
VTADRSAIVWSATWVPSRSPIEGFGAEGYAVAWVDTADGVRTQVLVAGPAPEPGTRGRLTSHTFGGDTVELFEAGAA